MTDTEGLEQRLGAPPAPEERSNARRRRTMSPQLEVLTVIVFTVAWAAANVAWLGQQRTGQPLNIDEAGYMGISLNYAGGWHRGGAGTWLDSVLAPSQHAPLTTAVTSLVTLTGWDTRASAFGVVLAFAVITVAFTCAFTLRLGIPGAALCSCLLLMSAPGFVGLSRNFVFAIPAAAVTMAALYFLQRSLALRSTSWTLAFGIAVGLMPLARTMMIAFVPVIIVVAGVHAAAHVSDGQVRRRVVNGAIGLAVAIGVAATWLLPSGRLVFEYLTDYGYGKHTRDYSAEAAAPPLRLLGVLGKDFFLPLLVLVAIGWAFLAWHAVRSSTGGTFKARVARVARSPLSCCAAFVTGCGLALMTSENAGFGFAVPLIAPTVIVASGGFLLVAQRSGPQWVPAAVVAAAAAFALLSILPRFDSDGFLARQRSIQVIGTPIPITLGAHTDAAYVFERVTFRSPGLDAISSRPGWADEWRETADELTDEVLDGSTSRPDVAFGFRNRFMNVNVVQLEILERLGYGVAAAQVDPTKWGRSKSNYVDWLTTGPAATSCQLVVSSGIVNEFTPLPKTTNLLGAATEVGFEPVSSTELPDGRKVEVWEREGAGC